MTKQQNQSSLDLGKVSMKVFYGSVSRTCAKYGSPDGTVFSTTACVKQVHNKATKWAQLCGYRSLSKLRSTRYTKFSLICIDYIFVKKKLVWKRSLIHYGVYFIVIFVITRQVSTLSSMISVQTGNATATRKFGDRKGDICQ